MKLNMNQKQLLLDLVNEEINRLKEHLFDPDLGPKVKEEIESALNVLRDVKKEILK